MIKTILWDVDGRLRHLRSAGTDENHGGEDGTESKNQDA